MVRDYVHIYFNVALGLVALNAYIYIYIKLANRCNARS